MGHETAGVIVEVGAGSLVSWPAEGDGGSSDPLRRLPLLPPWHPDHVRPPTFHRIPVPRRLRRIHGGALLSHQAGCVNAIPDNLSFEQATLAEPLACVINGQELLNVGRGRHGRDSWRGPIGCMHADLAKIRGARKVILADIQPGVWNWPGFGADILIDSKKEGLRERVLQETDGAGASVVIVAAPQAPRKRSPHAGRQARARQFLRRPSQEQPSDFVQLQPGPLQELFVMGAYGSAPRHNVAALELLAAGRIHAENLIGLLVPLERSRKGWRPWPRAGF